MRMRVGRLSPDSEDGGSVADGGGDDSDHSGAAWRRGGGPGADKRACEGSRALADPRLTDCCRVCGDPATMRSPFDRDNLNFLRPTNLSASQLTPPAPLPALYPS